MPNSHPPRQRPTPPRAPQAKPVKPRPIDDGRLAKRTDMFRAITQGKGKPFIYGAQTKGKT